MRASLQRFGDLDLHVIAPPRPKRAVLLLHGFGSSAADLLPLAGEMIRRAPSLRDEVAFAFAEGPIPLGDMGAGPARAWWMLELRRIAARRAGDAAELLRHRTEVPAGMPEARALVEAALASWLASLGLEREAAVVGGFSQGAMLATDLALHANARLAGLWILSGALVAEPVWRERAPLHEGLPVVQSHGRLDPVLGLASAEALRELLRDAALEVEWVGFEGEHYVPDEVVDRLAAALARR